MKGAMRRKKILSMLRGTRFPISGSELGRTTGVSRQIIVQDIALLRTEGHGILATNKGYLLDMSEEAVRFVKLRHSNEQTEDELLTIVDLGGRISDVVVNHRVYGKISAPLDIRSRRDVKAFMEDLRSGKSTPLLNVTSGYHFHHIHADNGETLDEIEAALQEKGYLSEIFPYEVENLE